MGTLLSPRCPLWTDTLRTKRCCAAYGGVAGPGGCPLGLRTQPRSGKFVTRVSKASPNVVESAAILTELVAEPHERLVELGTRMHDTERVGDDTTYEKLICYHGPLTAELVPGNASNPSDSARRLLTYNGDRQSEAAIMA